MKRKEADGCFEQLVLLFWVVVAPIVTITQLVSGRLPTLDLTTEYIVFFLVFVSFVTPLLYGLSKILLISLKFISKEKLRNSLLLIIEIASFIAVIGIVTPFSLSVLHVLLKGYSKYSYVSALLSMVEFITDNGLPWMAVLFVSSISVVSLLKLLLWSVRKEIRDPAENDDLF